MEKVQIWRLFMNNVLSSLTEKQKVLLYLSIALVLIIVVFSTIIYPVFDKNNKLNTQINNQKQLHTYLLDSQKSLQNNKIYANLNSNLARNIINKQFSNIQKSTIIRANNIILSSKKQNFAKILNAISSLKTNYGIVVVDAKIDKVASGLVDAHLTFKYP